MHLGVRVGSALCLDARDVVGVVVGLQHAFGSGGKVWDVLASCFGVRGIVGIVMGPETQSVVGVGSGMCQPHVWVWGMGIVVSP